MKPVAGGLTSAEAARRLATDGPNALPEVRPNRLMSLVGKFWAPIPWLLELAVVLEVVLGDYVQSLVFAILLIFNAVLAFAQEGRAQEAVELLRTRLTVMAKVRRDGDWAQVPAGQLVVGDLIHVRQGDLVPADLRRRVGASSPGPGAAKPRGLARCRSEPPPRTYRAGRPDGDGARSP